MILRRKKQAQVYQEYQAALQKNNALDFDDPHRKDGRAAADGSGGACLLSGAFPLYHGGRVSDTNTAQFELIRLLAGKYKKPVRGR